MNNETTTMRLKAGTGGLPFVHLLVMYSVMICPGLFLATAAGGGEQATAIQVNAVTVPAVSLVSAPAAQSITHDGTNTDQVFDGTSGWTVQSNSRSGATLSVTGTPFVNQSNTARTRPARLNLALASGAHWGVETAAGQTAGGNPAAVSAESSGAGSARFTVAVTFVETTTDAVAPSGTYRMTVTGTLTAK